MPSGNVISRFTRVIAAVTLAGLAGCATGPQMRDYHVSGKAVELREVPFYAQDGYQGGPAALAMMLAANGAQVMPADLVSLVYDPRTSDSPQGAMHTAASRYGRVPYVLKSKQLDLDVVHQVQSGHPVLVLLRTGVVLKQWQYAVVIGVDPGASTYTLRTGTAQHLVLSYGDFLAAWHDSGYWAMLTALPGDIPEAATLQDWLGGAALIEQAGKTDAAVQAYAAITQRWPDEVQGWAGLGRNYYAAHNPRGATVAFYKAATLQPDNAAVHDGLAKALLDRQCADQAEDEVDRALELERDPNLRAAYQQTQREVAKHSGPSVVCPLE